MTAPQTLALQRRPEDARLVVLSGDIAGRVLALGSKQMIIGRGTDADVELSGHDISREHVRLVRDEDGGWLISDLGSRNGTFVNGVPLARAQLLRAGDQIQLGTSVLLAFVVHRDVERRVLQLQKMEAVGQLAGGIAHDLANMLAVLKGTIDYVEMQLDKPRLDRASTEECLGEANEALTRASDLTRRLLDLSRARSDHACFDLAESVRDTARLCRHAIAKNIDLQVVVPCDLPVRGDCNQLHQVFLNLIMNARDAIGAAGGTISVSGEQTVSTADLTANDVVMIEVCDDGCGMDAQTRARALEPFYTTKASGKGTGLGLATVNSIVTRHGGSIEIESEPGRGSTFRVLLPMHKGPSTQNGTRDNLVAVAPTRRRVLLAWFDPRRQRVQQALLAAGFDVVAVDDGRSAVRNFERTRPRFDLVLVDDELPDLQGLDVLSIVSRLDARARSVLLDERARDAVEPRLQAVGCKEVLDRCSSTGEIVASVQRVLRDRP